jgi:hypothetical protein
MAWHDDAVQGGGAHDGASKKAAQTHWHNSMYAYLVGNDHQHAAG